MTDDDLNELAYSAHGEAMSFGLSHETFLRYFKTIRNQCKPQGEPDGAEAVKVAYARHKYAQGTRECIAFWRGAQWGAEASKEQK